MLDLLQLIICLGLSAFFSGMEIAFLSANRLRIELDRRQGSFAAHLVSFFIQKPDHYLATILIGNNVVLVVYGLIMARILGGSLALVISNPLVVLIVQTLLATLLILITGEFLPKMVFRLAPNFFLNFFTLPVFVVYIILYPLVQFILWLSGVFVSSKSGETLSHDKHIFGRIDLEHLVDEQSGKSNDLDTPHEVRIFRNALDFSKVRLRDCMVPRTDLAAIANNASLESVRKMFMETGFSKILVYHQSIDNIIGYLNIKDLFQISDHWQTKIIKAPFAPETMLASKMLRILMQEHKSLAIVVDEFGGTAGIVTIEDLMEEIFGEIQDEHDTDEMVVKILSDKSFVFSGRIEIATLNEKFNLNIPVSDEYETLAGYIMQRIGKIPSNNETFQFDGLSVKILKTSHNRIDLVYLKIEEMEK
ncbi:MAG TPA: hemolysin family protein [Bacteroidales bacterium]|nr:hemolysin family protein [Bacteroidales bacterium]HOK98957.1 hemolysin family protein [Bacteroidales bacterium]HPO65534.1 hemolysin family protein [Bacteroidales bacterium]